MCLYIVHVMLMTGISARKEAKRMVIHENDNLEDKTSCCEAKVYS